jgi:hypothetical protein
MRHRIVVAVVGRTAVVVADRRDMALAAVVRAVFVRLRLSPS